MSKLYHATLSSNADSIVRNGLIRNGGQPNYEFSNPKVVCLSSCPIVAKSFVEHADIEYDWDGESIVVFSLDREDLDKDYLSCDGNIHCDGEGSVLMLEYSKDIQPAHLTEETEYEEQL
tara:strand:+ start:61 stop:417 length:357 start_codon:yes stop_codon:yes gene_type:complete